jgi:hypothetical protein
MEIGGLKIPPGFDHPENRIGWFWGGMRVLCEYRIMTDSFVARFDTYIDGVQRNVCFDSNEVGGFTRSETPVNAQEFAWFCMAEALRAFSAGRSFEGKAAWTEKLNLPGEQ